MGTKQIVVDQDLHRQFHQDCVKKGLTMRAATERLIKDALGDSMGVEEIREKMYEDSAASTAEGGPMFRYGSEEKAPEVAEPRGIRVHLDSKSDW